MHWHLQLPKWWSNVWDTFPFLQSCFCPNYHTFRDVATFFTYLNLRWHHFNCWPPFWCWDANTFYSQFSILCRWIVLFYYCSRNNQQYFFGKIQDGGWHDILFSFCLWMQPHMLLLFLWRFSGDDVTVSIYIEIMTSQSPFIWWVTFRLLAPTINRVLENHRNGSRDPRHDPQNMHIIFNISFLLQNCSYRTRNSQKKSFSCVLLLVSSVSEALVNDSAFVCSNCVGKFI